MTDASISTIAHIIQLAVAPVFLLAGIGGILNVVATRLARVVDRVRGLEQDVGRSDPSLRAGDLRTLSILDRRMRFCHWAIALCVVAALLICLVVVILFIADLVSINFAIPVSLLFIAAMISLTIGLLLFLAEVTIATRSVRVNEEFVAREGRPMTAEVERRLLQAAVAFAALVPLSMGLLSVVQGPQVLRGVVAPVPVDLDSHFRYLSGLLLGIGVAFAACIPAIERRGPMIRALGAIVVIGGLSRLVSLAEIGAPGVGHRFGLAMELGVVPIILFWQARVARRFDASRHQNS